MAERFDDCPVHIGTVNIAWGRDAVASAITQMAKDVWEQVYVYM
jgi:hypothetical protein